MKPDIAVDSSVLIAIFNGEPEEDLFLETIIDARVVIGWPNAFEVRLWLVRHGRDRIQWFDAWLDDAAVNGVPWSREHEAIAAGAFDRFGRGRHPAQLNFGDCMAYAVAVAEGAPLLFKGADFGKTDVAVHPASALA